MKHSGTRLQAARCLALGLSVASLLACLMAGASLAWPGSAGAAVARGLADPVAVRLVDAAAQQAFMQELSSGLHASSVRLIIAWSQAEPQQGVDNETYMNQVAGAVSAAHANGLNVIVTFYSVPRWAQNGTLRKLDGKNRVPEDAFAPLSKNGKVPAFETFCRDFASRFVGQVKAYECWNEPNMYLTLFPQSTITDAKYGAHIYIKMLKSFAAGIRAGDPAALRIAGATAPRGKKTADKYSSSPQRFATVLKDAKLGSLFEVYSHHPYVPGASPDLRPEAAPRDPSTTVTLQNLGTLLRLFPTKQFYLTEYGYQTSPCVSFSRQYVSQVLQATYLRRAYSYVNRYPRVKLLMWYLLDDFSPSGSPTDLNGFYTGLRTLSGQNKRSWWAFARGNALTISAPSSIEAGSVLTLSGRLTHDGEGVPDKPLVVERRRSGGAWSTVKTAFSGADGTYAVDLKPGYSASYRLSWSGVVTSAVRLVKVQ